MSSTPNKRRKPNNSQYKFVGGLLPPVSTIEPTEELCEDHLPQPNFTPQRPSQIISEKAQIQDFGFDLANAGDNSSEGSVGDSGNFFGVFNTNLAISQCHLPSPAKEQNRGGIGTAAHGTLGNSGMLLTPSRKEQHIARLDTPMRTPRNYHNTIAGTPMPFTPGNEHVTSGGITTTATTTTNTAGVLGNTTMLQNGIGGGYVPATPWEWRMSSHLTMVAACGENNDNDLSHTSHGTGTATPSGRSNYSVAQSGLTGSLFEDHHRSSFSHNHNSQRVLLLLNNNNNNNTNNNNNNNNTSNNGHNMNSMTPHRRLETPTKIKHVSNFNNPSHSLRNIPQSAIATRHNTTTLSSNYGNNNNNNNNININTISGIKNNSINNAPQLLAMPPIPPPPSNAALKLTTQTNSYHQSNYTATTATTTANNSNASIASTINSTTFHNTAFNTLRMSSNSIALSRPSGGIDQVAIAAMQTTLTKPTTNGRLVSQLLQQSPNAQPNADRSAQRFRYLAQSPPPTSQQHGFGEGVEKIKESGKNDVFFEPISEDNVLRKISDGTNNSSPPPPPPPRNTDLTFAGRQMSEINKRQYEQDNNNNNNNNSSSSGCIPSMMLSTDDENDSDCDNNNKNINININTPIKKGSNNNRNNENQAYFKQQNKQHENGKSIILTPKTPPYPEYTPKSHHHHHHNNNSDNNTNTPQNESANIIIQNEKSTTLEELGETLGLNIVNNQSTSMIVAANGMKLNKICKFSAPGGFSHDENESSYDEGSNAILSIQHRAQVLYIATNESEFDGGDVESKQKQNARQQSMEDFQRLQPPPRRHPGTKKHYDPPPSKLDPQQLEVVKQHQQQQQQNMVDTQNNNNNGNNNTNHVTTQNKNNTSGDIELQTTTTTKQNQKGKENDKKQDNIPKIENQPKPILVITTNNDKQYIPSYCRKNMKTQRELVQQQRHDEVLQTKQSQQTTAFLAYQQQIKAVAGNTKDITNNNKVQDTVINIDDVDDIDDDDALELYQQQHLDTNVNIIPFGFGLFCQHKMYTFDMIMTVLCGIILPIIAMVGGVLLLLKDHRSIGCDSKLAVVPLVFGLVTAICGGFRIAELLQAPFATRKLHTRFWLGSALSLIMWIIVGSILISTMSTNQQRICGKTTYYSAIASLGVIGAYLATLIITSVVLGCTVLCRRHHQSQDTQ